MNIRRAVAGAAVVLGAMAAGTGVASAIPSVSYVPNDDPKTPVNEAGTVQTKLSPDEALIAAQLLAQANAANNTSDDLQQASQNSDCVVVNSNGLNAHTVSGYKNGPDGNCNQPVSQPVS